MAGAAERGKTRRDHRRLVGCRRLRRFVEPSLQPAHAKPLPAVAVRERHEGAQFERLAQVDLADLVSGCLSDEQVASLERSAEDRAWVALRSQEQRSFRGAGRREEYRVGREND
jgi:hypothetical protein